MNTLMCQQAACKSVTATIVKPGNAVRAVFIAGSRSPAVSARRCGVVVNARSQNIAYLNVKAKQQTSTSATSGKVRADVLILTQQKPLLKFNAEAVCAAVYIASRSRAVQSAAFLVCLGGTHAIRGSWAPRVASGVCDGCFST